MALASERVDTIDTVSVMTRGTLAIVDVDFAIQSSESLGAVACVSSNRIAADATVLTGSADTIVDVDVAFLSREARRTDTFVAIDHISTDTAIDARV